MYGVLACSKSRWVLKSSDSVCAWLPRRWCGAPCPGKLSWCLFDVFSLNNELFAGSLSSGCVPVCCDLWQVQPAGEASCSCVGFVLSPRDRDHTHKGWHVSGSWEGAWRCLNPGISSKKPQVLSSLLPGAVERSSKDLMITQVFGFVLCTEAVTQSHNPGLVQ